MTMRDTPGSAKRLDGVWRLAPELVTEQEGADRPAINGNKHAER
jgi:hypothetical protein